MRRGSRGAVWRCLVVTDKMVEAAAKAGYEDTFGVGSWPARNTTGQACTAWRARARLQLEAADASMPPQVTIPAVVEAMKHAHPGEGLVAMVTRLVNGQAEQTRAAEDYRHELGLEQMKCAQLGEELGASHTSERTLARELERLRQAVYALSKTHVSDPYKILERVKDRVAREASDKTPNDRLMRLEQAMHVVAAAYREESPTGRRLRELLK